MIIVKGFYGVRLVSISLRYVNIGKSFCNALCIGAYEGLKYIDRDWLYFVLCNKNIIKEFGVNAYSLLLGILV